eukprot:1890186-Amphidinium_carterae.2
MIVSTSSSASAKSNSVNILRSLASTGEVSLVTSWNFLKSTSSVARSVAEKFHINLSASSSSGVAGLTLMCAALYRLPRKRRYVPAGWWARPTLGCLES